MSAAWLEVVEPGLAVSVQDAGRTGYRSLGVPLSGFLDPLLATLANALVGNAESAACLEVRALGPTLKAVSGTVRVALAGALGGRVINARGQVYEVPAWHTATLFAGDTLRVGALARGVAYLGVSGGVAVPPQLGSRSTYARAALGGVAGRPLAAGDRLPCAAPAGDPYLESRGCAPWRHDDGPLRVVAGPQDDHFGELAKRRFAGEAFRVTRDLDRMGIRLEGPRLEHNAKGADIVSDGVAPGAIQVPGSGQPIVLLADCQTTGGYAKIATVIRADLPRLAHLAPGDEVRFAPVGLAEASAALAAQVRRLRAWIEAIETFRPPGVVDEAALYASDLIGGALRGDEPFVGDECTGEQGVDDQGVAIQGVPNH